MSKDRFTVMLNNDCWDVEKEISKKGDMVTLLLSKSKLNGQVEHRTVEISQDQIYTVPT